MRPTDDETQTPDPIFGEPLDLRRSIAIPGTYFGTRYVYRMRQAEGYVQPPLPELRPRRGGFLRVVLPFAILVVMLTLIAWLSMGYNGLR